VALNSQANTNFKAAQSTLANDVSQAMSNVDSKYKYLPALYLSLGYVF
jgi:hypothetical protein